MDEYWLCERCRSMVRRGAPRCYNCGALRPAAAITPRAESSVAPRQESVPVITPGTDDALVAGARIALARHRYQPVGPLAGAVGGVLLFLLGLDLVRYWAQTALHGFDGRSPAFAPDLPAGLAGLLDWLRILEPTVGLIAATLWFVFLGTSLLNAPALGAGTPAATWLDAVVDWFIPFRNLYRPYRVVRDLYARLSVSGPGGTQLVGFWWLACLVWFAINYLPIALQAIEILLAVAVGIGIFLATMGFGEQPQWTWFTSPGEILLIVVLAGVVGPASILLGGAAVVPWITVPHFSHTIPGAYLIDYLQVLLGTAQVIGEIAFVAAVLLWVRIVMELAQRQRVRAAWLRSPSHAAALAAAQH